MDTSGGRGFVVDMAEYGDTLEKIAADEIKRLREIPEVLTGTDSRVVYYPPCSRAAYLPSNQD